ncbi:MAG: FKBP-type peptidyl-prolyl cis-trans isomerase, partial [Muribaculaceae bacterium]|nr:FKBP-type peptidyl-prolyl cis-trans isomerase [Muribaculaceae bacterium]
AAAAILIAPCLASCLGDDNKKVDYSEWINLNETYLIQVEDSVDSAGNKVFEKITPVWAPGTGVYVLAQWHNDRSLTASNLSPMDNSTVDVIYECSYVNGVVLDSSYKNTTYGDSIYRCKPSDNIVGFWTMLTEMHVGDSVTCVIPTTAAYGNTSTSVIPYSALVYKMKLKSIYAYETSGN